jgi:hypothetical protein
MFQNFLAVAGKVQRLGGREGARELLGRRMVERLKQDS